MSPEYHQQSTRRARVVEFPPGTAAWIRNQRNAGFCDSCSSARVTWACEVAKAAAGAVLDVSLNEIERPQRRGARVAEARQVAMYLVHVAFQIPVPVMAHAFGRDRTTISHGIRRIEDRRDDPDFDALVSRLEALCSAIRLDPARRDSAARTGGLA